MLWLTTIAVTEPHPFMELLMGLLQVLITAAVPVLTTFVVKGIKTWTAKLEASTADSTLQQAYAAIAHVCQVAIDKTAQTYVDNLKKEGKFNVDEQKKALEKAKDTAMGLLSDATKALVNEVHGDKLTDLIEDKIEALIKQNKKV